MRNPIFLSFQTLLSLEFPITCIKDQLGTNNLDINPINKIFEGLLLTYNLDMNLPGSSLKPFENNMQQYLWAWLLQNHFHIAPFAPFQFQQIYLKHSSIKLGQSALPRALDQSDSIKLSYLTSFRNSGEVLYGWSNNTNIPEKSRHPWLYYITLGRPVTRIEMPVMFQFI